MTGKSVPKNLEPSVTIRLPDVGTSFGVAGIALLIYLSFTAMMLVETNGNLYGLFGFPQRIPLSAPEDVPWKDYRHPGSGYDGQFYFRLALDPFTHKKTDFGIVLDAPLFRQQRVLLPFLTWAVARGDPEVTPFVMMAINLLAVAGCAFAGGLLMAGFGVSAWYGLLFSLYPGFAVSVGRFLTEPLALCMMLLSLLFLVSRKNLLSAIALSLALLSRETAALFVAAGFFVWLWDKIFHNHRLRAFQPNFLFWLLPTLTFFSWQFWLSHNWSMVLMNKENVSKLGLPFAGFIKAMAANAINISPETGFYLLMASAVLLFQAFLLRSVPKFPLFLLISWVGYFMLDFCTKTAVWSNSTSFLRVSAELNLVGLLAYLIIRKIPDKRLILGWLLAWILTAGAEWYHLHSVRESFPGG